MTEQEAIRELQDRIDIATSDGHADKIPEYIGALKMAIEAIKRQTPTAPNWQGDEKCMDAHCPNCGEWLDDGEELCPLCHQIIDWRNGNE